jgi:predicted phosphodiesterase
LTLKVAVVSDTHAPYQDGRAIELACRIIQDFQPDELVHLADGIDFYALSTFSRDPGRVLNLQEEVDQAYAVNMTLASACPEANHIYLDSGNHEKRLSAYLRKHPEMHGLDVLDLPKLLRLEESGWTLGSPEREYLAGRLVLMHGHRVSKNAGWSVKRILEERLWQQSVVMGHSHRIGNCMATGARLLVGGWEVGCLCDLEPEWGPRHKNWQQGMATITIPNTSRSHCFGVEQVVFVGSARRRRAVWRGQVYIA